MEELTPETREAKLWEATRAYANNKITAKDLAKQMKQSHPSFRERLYKKICNPKKSIQKMITKIKQWHLF